MIRCYYPICLGIGLSLALATGVGASAAVDCGEPAPRTPEHPNLRTPERFSGSPMFPHADSGTETIYGASAAQRRDGLADVLAEGDQQIVVRDPVAARQELAEGEFGSLGGPGVHDVQTVVDAVNMGIHADAGFAESNRDDQVSRLAAHTLERQQRFEIVRDLAAILFEQGATNSLDRLGLGAVEAGWIDGASDSCRR